MHLEHHTLVWRPGLRAAAASLVLLLCLTGHASPSFAQQGRTANPWQERPSPQQQTDVEKPRDTTREDEEERLGRALSEKEYDALFEQLLDDPANLDLMFRFAQASSARGEVGPAISTYERMLLFNPDLPRIKLELGALYFLLGSFEVARGYLVDVADEDDLPQEVRDRTERMLASIDSATSRNNIVYTAFTGVRHQSNANSGPNDPNVRALGFDALLDSASTSEDDWNAFGSVSLVHTLDLDTMYGEIWENRLFVYATRQVELRELDLIVVDGRTGPHFAVLPELVDSLTVHPFISLTHVRLNREPLFTVPVLGFELSKSFGQNVLVSLSSEVRRRKFKISSRQPNAKDQNSVEVQFGGKISYRPFDFLQLTASGYYAQDEARENFESNDEVQGTLSADFLFDTPFGISERRSRLSVFGTRRRTQYDVPDPSVDPNIKRDDREWQFGASASLKVADNFAFETQVNRSRISSNLPNFTRNNWTVLFGVTAFW